MAAGDGNLPYDTQTVDPFDVVLSATQNEHIANIKALADGSGIGDGAIGTTQLADGSVTSSKIDFSGAGTGVWWEEIARGEGATISLTDIPPRKFLQLRVYTEATSGSPFPFFRFNNDSNNNYARRYTNNFGSESTDPSANGIGFILGQATADIVNIATAEKPITMIGSNMGTGAGASNLPNARLLYGKWANTTSQITRIDMTNGGSGALSTACLLVVLGRN